MMDSQRLLRLLGICFTACLLTTSQGFNIEMPTSVSAVEGSCVLVPCQTQKLERIIWYKYQSSGWPVVYDGRNLGHVTEQFKGRTSAGPSSEGNCSLRIDNIRMHDDITLFPYINPDSDKYYKPTVKIKTQPRTSPVISGPESPVKEGVVFSISCSIQHSCPPSPPSIQWKGVSVKTIKVSTERTDAGMWVTVSTVRVTAAHSLHSKQIHCLSTLANDESHKSAHITLDILFAPVDVKTSTKSRIIAERSNITLRCDSTSNPRPNLYQWLITNRQRSFQVNSSWENISISDIQRDFSAACKAYNIIGVGRSAKAALDVAFVSIQLPDSSCSETGRMFTCTCWVKAHPVATVIWSFSGGSNLSSSVIPVVKHKGNLTSAEIILEGKLAEWSPVVCVATNGYSTDTYQMTLLDAGTSPPWIVLACAIGFLGLCGLICLCQRKRQRNLAKDNNPSRSKEELKACGKRTRAPMPEEHKLYNKNQQDYNECTLEMDNFSVPQTQMMSQEEEAEDIYLNDMEDNDAENIYMNS